MAFCSLFSPKKLGVSASKFSPFLVPCSALQHFGLLPWWLKRPTIVWRRMQRRMRRIICWNTRPSKWTRRTCRWNRDLADLYWFMVEQLVIKLIQPLKVNVHAVSKLSSTLVIYFIFSTRFPPCWLMFYAVGWLCGQGTLSLSQHGQQADRREQLATLSILLSNHAKLQLGVASMLD